MKSVIHAVFQRLGYRYIIIGVSVYLLELIIIVTAQKLGASGVLAVGISFWVGLIVSFVLQKIVTFKNREMHRQVLVPQIIAFSALVLFNFVFTLLVVRLLCPPLPAVVGRTIALVFTTAWNFYLYKRHIFRNLKLENKLWY
jgi:putative flippase GtrA